jgi:hypothetical protein
VNTSAFRSKEKKRTPSRSPLKGDIQKVQPLVAVQLAAQLWLRS